MKKLLFIAIIFFTFGKINSTEKTNIERYKMKLNAGIITKNLVETKSFYVDKLGFGIVFENDWFLLLSTPGESNNLAFMLPNHPSQKPIFQSEFNGKGVFLTIEVEDVDKIYEETKSKNIPIEIEIRDEEWGDRHFAIVDPNGIGIDFVTNKNFD